MNTENQFANDQAPANDAAKDPVQQPQKSPAIQAVTAAMFADGKEEGVANVLKRHPEWRDEILAFLQQTEGNAFVHSVMHPGDKKGYGIALAREMNDAPAIGVGAMPSARAGQTPEQAGQQLRDQDNQEKAGNTPAPPAAESKPDAAAQSELGPAPPGGWRAPNLSASERGKLNDGLEGSAPAAQGPTPGPQSAEAKQEEPAPQHKNEAPPTNEVAPPGKQDIAAAGQGPAPAPPAQEAAPKADAKADEKGKDEKPEAKADGTEVKITASALRVRAEPSTKGAILGKIPRGKTAKVVGHENAWLKIEWDGKEAYIFAKYTTSVKGNESGEEEQEGEQTSSQEQKPERPKNPSPTNDENQQSVLV